MTNGTEPSAPARKLPRWRRALVAIRVIVSVVLVFVVLAIALLLSGNRRRTLMRWGLGVVVAMAITAAMLALARSAFLDVAKNRDSAAATFDILTSLLRNSLRTIAVLGLVVAVATFLSG